MAHKETAYRIQGGNVSGIPGLRPLDHVGFTVPDLEQAHTFLVDILGFECIFKVGPVESKTDWMEVHLNVHPCAIVRELRLYRCGGQAVFEVFQYDAPDQSTQMPKNSDHGGHHVALYVEDLESAVHYLRGHGVQLLGEPSDSQGPTEGQSWVYFLAPWGMQFDLVSYPKGRAFEHNSEHFC